MTSTGNMAASTRVPCIVAHFEATQEYSGNPVRPNLFCRLKGFDSHPHGRLLGTEVLLRNGKNLARFSARVGMGINDAEVSTLHEAAVAARKTADDFWRSIEKKNVPRC
jgi:hypothetical protein